MTSVVGTAGERPGRLLSLDALRGLDMFFLVGFGGIFRALPSLSDNSVFRFLSEQCRHPDWHGFTLWDMIFPLLLFIVGVAIPFSFAKRLAAPDGRKQLYKHMVVRAVVLTLLGLVYWGEPGGAHPKWGYYSVLYRIAVGYLCAGLIVLNARAVGQALWAGGLLAAYWAATRFVPVPGYGAGVFTEQGCLQSYVLERLAELVGPNCRYLFSITLIPSVSIVLWGALCGQWLRSSKGPRAKWVGLIAAGSLLTLGGLLAHQSVPINKKMWSASFTLLAGGLSTLLLGLFYWLIDVRGYRKWSLFFVVVGMNPITIYLVSRLVDFWRMARVFVGGFDELLGPAAPVVTAVTAAGLKWLFLYYLYVKKIFIRI